MDFARSELLLLIPFFIALTVMSDYFAQKIKKGLEVFHFPPVQRLIKIETSKNVKRHFWRGISFALKVMMMVLLTLSLAEPTLSVVSETSHTVEIPMVEEKDIIGGIVLTVDVSASMGLVDVDPSRLDAAKSMLAEFVRNASEKVRFGLVVFDADIREAIPLTEDKQRILSELGDLRASEGLPCLEELTDIGYALQTAAELVLPYSSTNGSYAIALVSDGFTNYGYPDPYTSIEDAVTKAVTAKAPVHTVHVARIGQDSNPELLEWVSNSTGGTFMESSNIEELRSVLDTLAKYHMPTNAWNAKVEIKTTIPQKIELGHMLMVGVAVIIVFLWVGNYRHYKTWF